MDSEEYKRTIKEIETAKKEGEIEAAIYLMERDLGDNLQAGEFAEKYGLFNYAYENFEKGMNEGPLSRRNKCLEKFYDLIAMVSPDKYAQSELARDLIKTKIKRDKNKKIIREKCIIPEEKSPKGNWYRDLMNKNWWNKIYPELVFDINKMFEDQNRTITYN